MTRPITAVKWNQTAAAFAEYFARLQGSVCNILVFGARTTFLSPKRGKKWKIQNNFGDTCDEDKGTATPLRKHFANFDSIVLKAGCSGLIDTLHVFFSTKTGNVFATIVSCKHATWYLAWRGFCGGKCENFDNANAKKKQWPETGAKQITNYLNAIFPTWTPLKKKISCTIISPKGGMHQDHVGSSTMLGLGLRPTWYMVTCLLTSSLKNALPPTTSTAARIKQITVGTRNVRLIRAPERGGPNKIKIKTFVKPRVKITHQHQRSTSRNVWQGRCGFHQKNVLQKSCRCAEHRYTH